MDSYARQLRYVLRGLRRSPLFTIVAIVTIAIGIGANAAIFSVVNGVLLKPLPYPQPDRLISVRDVAPGIDVKGMGLSPADYFTFHDESRTLERFGIWNGNRVSVTGLGAPEEVRSISVTADTLPALGVPPAFGRWFSISDDAAGAAETAILSNGYWQRKFGGARSVIGRGIHINGRLCHVVGVMPAGFRLLDAKADISCHSVLIAPKPSWAITAFLASRA